MPAQPNLPIVDPRQHIRLWDQNWNCIAETRIKFGQRVDIAIQELMGDLEETRVTIDRAGVDRWSGFVYRDGCEIDWIDQSIIGKISEWRESPL